MKQVKTTSKTLIGLSILTITLFTLSCTVKSQSSEENLSQTESSRAVSQMSVNVNKYPSNKLVCNPFDGTTPQMTYEQGIKASLHYLTTGMPRMYKATDYVQFARKSDKTLFLKDMNVPTRMFTEGFSTANGDYLKNDSGEKLIEYFGLKMNTNLILSDNDDEGLYELALLSDDGSNLIIKSGTDPLADELIIANDGDHPTKMGCAQNTVRFRKNVMIPIEVTYYQGPKYHISNVLIWRKATTAGTDPLCNQLGNELYFNPNKGSAPQKAFNDLLSRGWKVVQPQNFRIAIDKTDYNPCVQGTNPVISHFSVGEVVLTSVYFSWTTDIPATAQLQLTNLATGVVTTTTSDNMLRTSHEVTVDGLHPATDYKVQAISISQDLGRSLSAELRFRTQ